MKILMSFGFLLVSCCLLNLVNTQDVKFAAIDSSGKEQRLSATAGQGSKVKFNCSFNATERAQRSNITVKISTKVNAGDAWIGQVVCRYGSDSNISGTLDNDTSPTVFSKDNATCTINTLYITLMAENLPKYFQCLWAADGIAEKEVEIVFRLSIRTTVPKIEQNPPGTITEGSRVEFKCESSGKPPPVLGFVLRGEKISASELIHVPPRSSITDDSAEGASTITWTTEFDRDIDGKSLVCRNYNHLSQLVAFKEIQISVSWTETRGTTVGVEPTKDAETGGVGLKPTQGDKAAAGVLKPGLIAIVVTVEMLVMLIL